jgi:hypothetical protein
MGLIYKRQENEAITFSFYFGGLLVCTTIRIALNMTLLLNVIRLIVICVSLINETLYILNSAATKHNPK